MLHSEGSGTLAVGHSSRTSAFLFPFQPLCLVAVDAWPSHTFVLFLRTRRLRTRRISALDAIVEVLLAASPNLADETAEAVVWFCSFRGASA